MLKGFEAIATVKSVHQFHVWGVSGQEEAIMMHLVTNGLDDRVVFKEAVRLCRQNNFRYYSIQIESPQTAVLCPNTALY